MADDAKPRRLLVVGLLLLTGVIGFALLSIPPTSTQTAEPENAPLPVNQAIQGATQNKPDPASTTAPSKLISYILETPVGQVSSVDAQGWVDALAKKGSGAAPQIKSLLTSENEVERLLGVHLTLEQDGPTKELLRRVLADDSFHLKADLTNWMYLNHRFREWDAFLREASNALDSRKLGSLVALFESRGGTLEVPATMSSLRLGRNLEEFTKEAFRRSPAAVERATEALLNETFDETAALNLLKTLDESGAPGYTKALIQVISSDTGLPSVRWQAVQNTVSIESNERIDEFLADYLIHHPTDELSDKITQTLRMSNERKYIGLNDLENDLITEVSNLDAGSPPPETFLFFVEKARYSRAFTPNPGLLNDGLSLLEALPAKDYNLRRRIADIHYMLTDQ